MENNILFLFDCFFFPITCMRLAIIFLYGSRYNINKLKFMDDMMHATGPYFDNMDEKLSTVNIPVAQATKGDISDISRPEINTNIFIKGDTPQSHHDSDSFSDDLVKSEPNLKKTVLNVLFTEEL